MERQKFVDNEKKVVINPPYAYYRYEDPYSGREWFRMVPLTDYIQSVIRKAIARHKNNEQRKKNQYKYKNDSDIIYNTKEVCHLLGVHRHTLRKMRNQEHIEKISRKPKQHPRFTRRCLEHFLKYWWEQTNPTPP